MPVAAEDGTYVGTVSETYFYENMSGTNCFLTTEFYRDIFKIQISRDFPPELAVLPAPLRTSNS